MHKQVVQNEQQTKNNSKIQSLFLTTILGSVLCVFGLAYLMHNNVSLVTVVDEVRFLPKFFDYGKSTLWTTHNGVGQDIW